VTFQKKYRIVQVMADRFDIDVKTESWGKWFTYAFEKTLKQAFNTLDWMKQRDEEAKKYPIIHHEE
jgi:hypothetical protein